MHKQYDLYKALIAVVLRKYERFYEQIAQFNIRISRGDYNLEAGRYSGKSKTVTRLRRPIAPSSPKRRDIEVLTRD